MSLSFGGFNSQPPEGGCDVQRCAPLVGGCFNSQPPEGGCRSGSSGKKPSMRFQLTAARRRLPPKNGQGFGYLLFQLTAARRRLPRATRHSVTSSKFQLTAARRRLRTAGSKFPVFGEVSTHSRPKAAARYHHAIYALLSVSTHSRPKAAAIIRRSARHRYKVSTHSRPKAAASIAFSR